MTEINEREQKLCQKCNSATDKDSRFCKYCGFEFTNPDSVLSDEKITQFGEHLTIDGYNGDRNLLDSKKTVLAILKDLPAKLGMNILSNPRVVLAPDNDLNDPGGWSGFVIIAESHISIHTFPKRCFVSADIYTCKKGMDIQIIIDYFTNAFKLSDVETNLIKRGTRYPLANFTNQIGTPSRVSVE